MLSILRITIVIFLIMIFGGSCSPEQEEVATPEAQEHPTVPELVAAEENVERPPLASDISPEVYRVVDENDYVRVVIATWKPGQRDLLHYHPPFAAYSLTEIEGMLYYPDNTEWPVKIPEGKPMVQRGDESHAFESLADKETGLLIVERKIDKPVVMPEGAAPLSHEVSPEIYKVVAENDYLRVIVATWQPGQRDVQHSHPPFGAYMLTDIEGMLHYPDGSTWPVHMPKGKAVAQRGDESHAFENVSEEECRMLIVEAK